MEILPIPELPKFSSGPTPIFLKVFIECGFRDDRNIQFRDFTETMSFYYDHYYEHAKQRLISIHGNYCLIAEDFSDSLKKYPNTRNISGLMAEQVYWDFEDYLAAMRSLLDIYIMLCRAASSAPGSFPSSFSVLKERDSNKVRELVKLTTLYPILKDAYNSWAKEMIDYRNFYMHYAPFEEVHSTRVIVSESMLKINHRLPDSLKVKNLKFEYYKNKDVFEYSIEIFRKNDELQSALANEICSLNLLGNYPHTKFDYKLCRPMNK